LAQAAARRAAGQRELEASRREAAELARRLAEAEARADRLPNPKPKPKPKPNPSPNPNLTPTLTLSLTRTPEARAERLLEAQAGLAGLQRDHALLEAQAGLVGGSPGIGEVQRPPQPAAASREPRPLIVFLPGPDAL